MALAAGSDRIPGRDLVDRLTDEEVAGLARSLGAVVDGTSVDVAAARTLLAGWMTTARIRSHPDFARQHEAFQRAMGDA